MHLTLGVVMRGLLLTTAIALVRFASPMPSVAQEPPPPVQVMIADFEQAMVNPSRLPSGCCWVVRLILHRSDYSPELLTRVLDELESVALTSSNANVRLYAIGMIATAGEDIDDRTPGRLDAVERLVRIYQDERTPVNLKRAALTRIFHQANRDAAIQFLVHVASSGLPGDDTDWPVSYLAIDMLSRRGERGREALRLLHEQGTVTSARGRGYLQYLAERGFQPR